MLKQLLQKSARRLAGVIARVCCRVSPKERKVLIHTIPDFDDSARALAACAAKRGYDVIVITRSPKAVPNDLLPFVSRVATKYSLRGVWDFLTASIVFFSHGYLPGTNEISGRCVVNVWHGMPLKRIGRMIGEPIASGFDLLLATGVPHQKILAECFDVAPAQVLVIGNPRNDVLAGGQVEAKRPSMLSSEKRLVVWLPTYRHAAAGSAGASSSGPSVLESITKAQWEEFDEVLGIQNAMLVVKPHPLDRVRRPDDLPSSIVFVDDDDLRCKGTSLYGVLAHSDALITDFSSVYIDYLLTDRPVLFFCPDVDDYHLSRGFLFEMRPPFIAGKVVTDVGELLRELSRQLSCPETDASVRRASRELFHSYYDSQSTERVMNEVENRLRARSAP